MFTKQNQAELSDVPRRHGSPLGQLSLIAAAQIVAYSAVTCQPAQRATLPVDGDAVGIALNRADPGQRVRVALPGEVVANQTWNWTAGIVRYDPATGLLNQATGLQIGVALTATSILVTHGSWAEAVAAVGDGLYAPLVHTHVASDITDFTSAVQAVGDARYVELTGDTMTGGLTVPTLTLTGAFLLEDSGVVAFDIRSLANTDIPIRVADASSSWTFGLDNSDSNSFVLASGTGLGTGNVLRAVPAELSTPVNFVAGANVTLSTGRLFLPNGTESAASLTFANGRGIYATSPEDINFTDGSVIRVQFRLQDNNNTGIEIGRVDGIASVAYYDFHTSATPVDYDARMIVQTGTGVTAQARMDFYCGQFTLTPVGTDALPTLARTADLDTGLLWPASDTLAASCGTTRVWTATSTDVEFPVGISLGSGVASGATDVTRHIAMFGTTYGFSVTSNTLNHVANGTTQDFYTASVNRVRINASGLNVLSGTLSQGGVDAVLDSDIGATVQAWDADLDAIAALASTGFAVRSAANTWVQRTITTPNAGLTTTNGNGVSGNVSINPSDDLAAIEALASTGLAARTAANTWAQRTITAGQNISVTNGNGVSGNPTIALDRVIEYGTFSPTYTGVTSVENLTADGNARYVRVGEWCHVWGRLNVNPSVASGVVEFTSTLPVASNLTTNEQLSGTGVRDLTGALKEAWVMDGNVSDLADFRGFVNSTNNIGLSYHYSYVIA